MILNIKNVCFLVLMTKIVGIIKKVIFLVTVEIKRKRLIIIK